MVADGDRCFRVSGIPDEYTESQIAALLTRELGLDEDVFIDILSLARNPLRSDERIATLSFSRIPAKLSERGQHHINIPPSSSESGNQRRQVVLDSHFEGFTPLHTNKDDECHMDIVALSGLNGHAFGSFKMKDGPHMWLRDALPFDIPKARIFIYGYDTSPDNFSFQNVWDLESTFRQRLRMLRYRSGMTRQPFVIIAHSLGGIIAKAAVLSMVESPINGDRATFNSLRGILLFGVPSEGMDIESLIAMTPASETRALLFSLDKTNSPTLRELGENFPKAINKLHEFETFNFYETRESPTAIRDDNGQWQMKGPPTVLVTPFSATQGKLSDEPRHRVIALNRTHSEMIKFSGTNDNDYEITLSCLKEIEEKITHECRVWPAHILSDDEQKCLQSLSFIEQYSRECDLTINAAEGTCTWILEHKNYRSWLTTNPGPLWIMGPPGAGKSTLMKFLVKMERESQRGSGVVASFFIHSQGSEMRRSNLGLFRSLLHQMLPHCPASFAILTELYNRYEYTRGTFGQKWTWEEEQLREIFVSTVQMESRQCPITIFIDGLDEMDEECAVNLTDTLEPLCRKDHPQDPGLRVCFSSRYYPNLIGEGSLSVAVEKENMDDINSFIEAHPALPKLNSLGRDTITRLVIQRANGIFQWVALILGRIMHLRRRGQSTEVVIDTIKRVPGTLKGIYKTLLVFDDEDGEADREQALKLFQWILFSYRPLTVGELRQALAIDANMTHTTLAEIARSKLYYQIEDMPAVVHNLSRGLARLSPCLDGGCENDRYVETVHQSVNDYLMESGLETLASAPGHAERLGHFQLSRSCIRLLHTAYRWNPLNFVHECANKHESPKSDAVAMKENEEERCFRCHPSDSVDDWIDAVPLAAYASSLWLVHVMAVERHLPGQEDLLGILPWRKKQGDLPVIFTSRFDRPSDSPLLSRIAIHYGNPDYYRQNFVVRWIALLFTGEFNQNLWDPAHLLALAGIHSALDEMERVEPGIYNRVGIWGQSTLLFALAGRNEQTIASAIDALSFHHVRSDELVMSPLFVAVTHSREDWVRAIITKGADLDHINKPCIGGQESTALYQAYSQKDEKMVRELLTAGADPTVFCTNHLRSVTIIQEVVGEANGWGMNLLPLLIESAVNLHPTQRLADIQDALSYAIKHSDTPLMQAIFDCGALVDSPNCMRVGNKPAIKFAAESGYVEVVKALLERQASLRDGSEVMNSHWEVSLTDALSSVLTTIHPGDSDSSLVPSPMNNTEISTSQGSGSSSRGERQDIPSRDSWPKDTILLDFSEAFQRMLELHRTDQRFANAKSITEQFEILVRNRHLYSEPPSLSSGSDDETDSSATSTTESSLDLYSDAVDMTVYEASKPPSHRLVDVPNFDAEEIIEPPRSMRRHRNIQATRLNYLDIVQILLKWGANPNKVLIRKRSPLQLAVATNDVELARILLRSGADPTLRGAFGTTLLQAATSQKNLEIISLLLHWTDNHGRTLIMLELSNFREFLLIPFSGSRDRTSWVIRQVLLNTKYNFDSHDDDGLTALSYAVIKNVPDIVDLLLDYGRCNPNTQNSQGETPLMRAASSRFNRILRRLLDYPLTDVAMEDKKGLTAMDHARNAGNDTAEALLRQKQDNPLINRQRKHSRPTHDDLEMYHQSKRPRYA